MSSVPTTTGLEISPLRSVLKQRSSATLEQARPAGTAARDEALAREAERHPAATPGGRRQEVAEDGGIDLLRPRMAARRRPPRWGLLASFVLLVGAPTTAAAVYYLGYASNQYVSSAKFALRAADQGTGGEVQSLRDAPSSPAAVAASFVVADYLHTRQFVDEVDKAVGLREMLSKPSIDAWARLDPTVPIESLVSYWRGLTNASYDLSTGIISVSVRSFTPLDSLTLANAVVEGSEKIANDLTHRSRQDILRSAETQLEQAESRLKTVQTGIAAFRKNDGAFDPTKLATSNAEQLTKAKSELSEMKTQLAYLSSTMTPAAPSIRALAARIKAKEDQVAELAGSGAGSAAFVGADISSTIGRFETLEAEKGFAEKSYAAALDNLQRARATADRQQIYLSAYVRPALAESSQYPNRFAAIGLVCGIALMGWLVSLLLVLGVRDHMR